MLKQECQTYIAMMWSMSESLAFTFIFLHTNFSSSLLIAPDLYNSDDHDNIMNLSVYATSLQICVIFQEGFAKIEVYGVSRVDVF